jgi:hypothetical protein
MLFMCTVIINALDTLLLLYWRRRAHDLAAGLTSAVSTAGIMLCFSRSASNSPDWCTARNCERRRMRDTEKARTAEDDVTPAHELAVHIQLRHRRPLPAPSPSAHSPPRSAVRTHEYSLMSARSCWSCRTSNVRICACGTSCISSTCTAARENPHCGCARLPFMNSTTGVLRTALSSAARASLESHRAAAGRNAPARSAGVSCTDDSVLRCSAAI